MTRVMFHSFLWSFRKKHYNILYTVHSDLTALSSFIGCELSSKVPFYTFQGDEEEDLEHFLELRTVFEWLIDDELLVIMSSSAVDALLCHTLLLLFAVTVIRGNLTHDARPP